MIRKIRLYRYLLPLQHLHKWLFRAKFILLSLLQEDKIKTRRQVKKRSDRGSKQQTKDIKFVLMQLANKSNEC